MPSRSSRLSRRAVLAGTGTLAAAGLAGCATDGPARRATPGSDPDTEWPQPGGTDRYDCYRSDAAAPRNDPSERWSVETVYPLDRPVVAGGRVLLSTHGGLFVYDLESGEETWSLGAEDDEPDVRTAPVVVDGTVYVGVAFPHGVLAANVEEGRRLWHAELAASPTVAPVVGLEREHIAVGTNAGLAGFDVGGDPLWARETFSPVSALTSWGDLLYAGTDGGELYCLHGLGDPQGLWRRQLDGAVVQVAQLDGGDVVASAFGGPLTRRDEADAGAARWTHDATGTHGFVAAGNTYGVGRGLTSVHTRTGERHWTVGEGFHAPPAGAGDTVYSGGEGFVAAYAMDGGTGAGDYRVRYERWRHGVEGTVNEGVSVADGAAFAIASAGDGATLYALE